jgi:hypothetical protein
MIRAAGLIILALLGLGTPSGTAGATYTADFGA